MSPSSNGYMLQAVALSLTHIEIKDIAGPVCIFKCNLGFSLDPFFLNITVRGEMA